MKRKSRPWGGGGRGKDGWREGGAITAVSSVTDLHRPLHSHSPPALINGIIEQCGIPLKFLLRFHKKKIKLQRGNERGPPSHGLLAVIPTLSRRVGGGCGGGLTHLSHNALSLLYFYAGANCAAKAGESLITRRCP